mmetsp:Transcript_25155/g.44065  ORF Transcript_25155/g.44065 Transcript_25155/m.44065 type:complete len:173 (+) Transcript_25155:168-686(+)
MRSKLPDQTLAGDIFQFGLTTKKVDGELKKTTNRYIMRLNNPEEVAKLTQDLSKEPEPTEFEERKVTRVQSQRKSLSPRCPPINPMYRAKSAPKFEKTRKSLSTTDRQVRIQPHRSKLHQKIYFAVLSKPRTISPLARPVKKKKISKSKVLRSSLPKNYKSSSRIIEMLCLR